MSSFLERFARLSDAKRTLFEHRLEEVLRLDEPVAIVGMACRLPGAPDLEAYWRLLATGADAVGDVPAARWDAEAFYHREPRRRGKMSSRQGAFLARLDELDAGFFGISPREAELLDPQQRLLLELSWEALEDAGLVVEKMPSERVGVFMGVMNDDFKSLHSADFDDLEAHSWAGWAASVIANRISYQLDFRGPSVTVDTACSSSLVALHLASESLRRGESQVALAGGVNVILSPGGAIFYGQAGLLAADGRCKSFDARADGIVRGEGAGVVVLKRLSDALADGDAVRAVVRGSAVGHDGSSNGLTAPSRRAQEEVLRAAWKRAGLPPVEVDYVEAHGTGTPLGDPIEAQALGAVVGAGRAADRPCLVGSVKSNLGHLESAAGIAALIKTVLALEKRQIPPSLHFVTPNPRIDFAALGLRVVQELTGWPESAAPARAAVSSFGLGGTNAHVVLEQAPSVPRPPAAGAEQAVWLLPLSARAPGALHALAEATRGWLETAEETAVAAAAATAALRRTHHPQRLVVVGGSRGELVDGLASFGAGEPHADCSAATAAARSPQVVFVFSGQGPQRWDMGRELLAHEPRFREVIERCDALLASRAGWSLVAELQADEEASRLDETLYAQPALFALQMGLVELWRTWGVEPSAVVGHSLGEVAAACAAGVLTLEQAVELVALRAQRMQEATGWGTMLSVALGAEEVRELAAVRGGRATVAALNSPRSTVLAGEREALGEAAAELAARGVHHRFLGVDYAFHSPPMEALAARLKEELAGLEPAGERIPYFSSVSGGAEQGHGLGAEYWRRNVAQPVDFRGAVEALLAAGYRTFLEIGPHPVLHGPLAECLHAAGLAGEGRTLSSLRRGEGERRTLLTTFGTLWTLGVEVSWKAVCPAAVRPVRLPTYPWQRERHWPPPRRRKALARGVGDPHPLLGPRLELAPPATGERWSLDLDLRRLPFLADHRIGEAIVLPGTAYVEMVLAAAAARGPGPWELCRLELLHALELSADDEVCAQLVITAAAGEEVAFTISSRRAGAWIRHATGRLRSAPEPAIVDLEELRRRLGDAGGTGDDGSFSGEMFYGRLAAAGNRWGPAFQGLTRIWRRDDEALGEVRAPAQLEGDLDSYRFHPAVFDACLHLAGATLMEGAPARGAFLPVGADAVRFYGGDVRCLWSHVRFAPSGEGELRGEVRILDPAGRVVVEVEGARLQFLATVAGARRDPGDWLYAQEWEPRPWPSERHAETSGGGRWCVFADGGGVGEALSRRLAAAGERTLTVRPGAAFEAHAGGFRIRPGDGEDLRRLVAELDASAADAEADERWRILHLWSLDAPAGDEVTAGGLERALDLGLRSATALARALAVNGAIAAELWLVTRGAQDAGGGAASETPRPPAVASAPLIGFGRALAQERPGLWGGLVDLDPEAGAADAARHLLDHVRHPNGEDQVAVRGDHLLAARLRRLPAATTAEPGPVWRRDGSYLVSGGFGDLGLLVARWLAERGARRLILLGRSPLPPRESWLEVAPESPEGRRIAAIRDLESRGVAVHPAAVDLADATAVERFFTEYRAAGWPPVRGLIHAAGVAELTPLEELDANALARAWGAKAAGAWHLLEQLDGELDVVVFFASMAGVHGVFGRGLGGYAAANAFLDALARLRRYRGGHALSLDWGPWRELGMLARSARGGEAVPGVASFTPAEGLAALERVLGTGRAEVAVVNADWPSWRRLYPAASRSPFLAEVIGAAELEAPRAGLGRAELLAVPPAERLARLRQHLAEIVSGVLRIRPQKLDEESSLTGLGFDSLMAIEVKNALETGLGVDLPLVHLVSGPSLAELVPRVLEIFESGAPAAVAPSAVAPSADEPFALSYGQRSLWYLYQVRPQSAAYNVAFSVRVVSAIDVDVLDRAFRCLVARHESLRTVFFEESGEPWQRAEPALAVGLETIDAAGASDDELRAAIVARYEHPFDLAESPVRLQLFRRGPSDAVVLLTLHHIVADGWSLLLLFEELAALYGAAGAAAALPPPEAQYRHFVARQQEMLAGPEGERLWRFWRDRLAGELPVLELPAARPRPPVPSYRGGSLVFRLDPETSRGLRELARAEGATLYMTLAAGFLVFLHRTSGQARVLLGSSTSGRHRPELTRLVGHLVNPVVLDGRFSEAPSFRHVLADVRRQALAAFEHQDYPFPLLVERLAPPRVPGCTPIYQVSFVHQNLPSFGNLAQLLISGGDDDGGVTRPPVGLAGLSLLPYPLPQQEGQFDLELEMFESGETLLGVLHYATDLFDAATIELWAGRLSTLYSSLVAQPGVPVDALEMLTDAERQQRARQRAQEHEGLRVGRRKAVQVARGGA